MLRTIFLVKLDILDLKLPYPLPVRQPQVGEACKERARCAGAPAKETRREENDESQACHDWPAG